MLAAGTSEPKSSDFLSSLKLLGPHVAIMTEAIAEIVVYYNYLTPSLAASFPLIGQYIFFPILCIASIYHTIKACQQCYKKRTILNTINLIVSILTATCINVSLIGLMCIGIPFWFFSGVLFTVPLIPTMIHATISIITFAVELSRQTADSDKAVECRQAIAKAFFDLIIAAIKTVFLFGCSIAYYGIFMPFSLPVTITTGLISMVLMTLRYAWEMPLVESSIKSSRCFQSFFKPFVKKKNYCPEAPLRSSPPSPLSDAGYGGKVCGVT